MEPRVTCHDRQLARCGDTLRLDQGQAAAALRAIMISNIFSGPILKMRDNCRLGGAEGRTFSGGEAVTLVTAGDQ